MSASHPTRPVYVCLTARGSESGIWFLFRSSILPDPCAGNPVCLGQTLSSPEGRKSWEGRTSRANRIDANFDRRVTEELGLDSGQVHDAGLVVLIAKGLVLTVSKSVLLLYPESSTYSEGRL